MNYWLVLLVVVVVVFMFSGGKVEKVPAKLKSSAKSFTSGNKMVVGILVGLALCWFLGNGNLIEGSEWGTGSHGEELDLLANASDAQRISALRLACCPPDPIRGANCTDPSMRPQDGDQCFDLIKGIAELNGTPRADFSIHHFFKLLNAAQCDSTCQADAGADSSIDQSADECHRVQVGAINNCRRDCDACDTDTLNVALGGCAISGTPQVAGPGGNICPSRSVSSTAY